MEINLGRPASYEDMHYNQYDQVALLLNMYKLVISIKNFFFTFVMHLKWVATIAYI